MIIVPSILLVLVIIVIFCASLSIVIGLVLFIVLININYNYFYYNRHVMPSDIFSYFWNTLRFIVKFVALSARSKEEVELMTKDNTKFCGDFFNSTLCKCLYLNKNYEPSITDYFRNKLKKGDVVVDVGANEGIFSILAGKLVGSSGKVYSVEPLPRNVSILKKNIQLNKLNNIVVCDIAAGAEEKDVVFFDVVFNNMLGGADNIISNILSKIPRMVKLVKVKQKRLDAVIREPVDKIAVIKIDTEGYEEFVLNGIDTWLDKNITADFIIEMTPRSSKKIIELLVTKLNYTGHMHWMDSVAYNDNVNWEKLDVNCNNQKNVLFTKSRII